MFKKLKWIIYTKPFVIFIYYFIRIYSLTFSLGVKNEEKWMRILKQGRPVVICGWHQQFFAAINHFGSYRHLKPALMISQSRDGELIAGVAKRSGWETARGSSSSGGRQALEEMIDHLRRYGLGAHILDGPRGPMGKVKPGAIKMARESGGILVPFFASSDSAWFFNSWDRFMLPKPLSRVTLEFGTPIVFPEPKTPLEFEEQRLFLEQIMTPRLKRAGAE
ncbi:MAG: lysophospholipid acyltransferase family protein [Desulfamplus sp.]|nr:lysophospholipid acyltransferase family protein [Desulfamplus sp.]